MCGKLRKDWADESEPKIRKIAAGNFLDQKSKTNKKENQKRIKRNWANYSVFPKNKRKTEEEEERVVLLSRARERERDQ